MVAVACALAIAVSSWQAVDADTKGVRIKVKKPNGGEIWVRGDRETIKWRSFGFTGANVRIELLQDGQLVETIKAITPNDGRAKWVVPTDIEVDDDYTVRVISIASPLINDTSNEEFTIIGLP